MSSSVELNTQRWNFQEAKNLKKSKLSVRISIGKRWISRSSSSSPAFHQSNKKTVYTYKRRSCKKGLNHQRRESIESIKAISGALIRLPSLRINGYIPTFSDKIPPLFYPKFSKDDKQNQCKDCLESEEFFKEVGAKLLLAISSNEDKNVQDTQKLMLCCKEIMRDAAVHETHEIQELVELILDGNKSCIFRRNSERWKRLKKYVSFLELELKSMEAHWKGRKLDPATMLANHEWKSLKFQLHEGNHLVKHCEQRILETALICQMSRIKKTPFKLKKSVASFQDVMINRLCNAFVMSNWTKFHIDKIHNKHKLNILKESKGYESSSVASDPEEESVKKWEGEKRKWSQDFHIKLCNTKRRNWNLVKPRLPSQFSHLYAFYQPNDKNIHPSWYQTLMEGSRVTRELRKLRESNQKIDGQIQSFEKNIQILEIEDKVRYLIDKERQIEKSL